LMTVMGVSFLPFTAWALTVRSGRGPCYRPKSRVLVETPEAYAIHFLKVLDKSLLLVET